MRTETQLVELYNEWIEADNDEAFEYAYDSLGDLSKEEAEVLLPRIMSSEESIYDKSCILGQWGHLGIPEVVQFLLDQGLNNDDIDVKFNCAEGLVFAGEQAGFDILKSLIKPYLSIDSENEDGIPLHWIHDLAHLVEDDRMIPIRKEIELLKKYL